MRNTSDGKGVMGINMQPSFPTGVTMEDYVAPSFCGDQGADKANQTFFSCVQTLEATQKCCCTGKHSVLKKCDAWTCCAAGTACKQGVCA